jgi:hypothetical protein
MSMADGELYMHVHKKLVRNQNEFGNNCRFLWQRDEIISWHLFCVGLCFVLSSTYHCLLLSLKHVTPNLYKLDWQ